MLYKDLTEKIIRAAMNVHNTLGFGFMEKVYENSLMIELKSIEKLDKIHEVQLVYYLKAVNMEVGLLLNFGKEELEFKRKVLNL